MSLEVHSTEAKQVLVKKLWGFFREAALPNNLPLSEENLRDFFSRYVDVPEDQLLAFLNNPHAMQNMLKAAADRAHGHYTKHLPPEVITAYTANTIAVALNIPWAPLPTPGLEHHGNSIFDHEASK